jgi:uncharacterized protein involved in exopolysaccharide biosynthesis
MEGNNSNTKELGTLSIKDLFFKYIRFLPIFLISVALSLLGAYLYLRYSTPIYRAQGSISFKDENQSRGGRFEQILSAKTATDMQTEMEILKSRPLMERVVKAANLQTS